MIVTIQVQSYVVRHKIGPLSVPGSGLRVVKGNLKKFENK
jgi:hypothetical protein